MVPFPDFARVTIHRLEGKRAEILHVNVADMIQSGDGSKDAALRAGDLVGIPWQEHKVAEKWYGLSPEDVAGLNKCLLRKVKIISQGHTNELALLPCFADAAQNKMFNYSGNSARPDMQLDGVAEAVKTDTVVRSFLLNNVVRDANVLLNTWDLSRARLTRGGVKTMFDLTANPPPDVWLENGDVIEIPEIGETGPGAEPK
jgi:hypothetical protein